jgi:hypothetical protein
MAVQTASFTPIVDAIENVEAAAARVVLACGEKDPPLTGELVTAVSRLAAALWELQEARKRAREIAAEVGTPPLHVVEL